MKRILTMVAAGATALSLGACANGYYAGDYGRRHHHGDRYHSAPSYEQGWYDRYGNYHPPRRR